MQCLPITCFQLNPKTVPLELYARTAPERRNALTWSIVADGRVVPFRYLRLDPTRPRPTVLFFHGMGLQIASFWGIAPYLFATHDLLLPDYTSFSQPSAWPGGGLTLKQLTLAACRIPPMLGLERVSVIGSSLGGGMCVIAAIEFPSLVEKIVLINAACYPQRLPGFYRLVRVPILGELLMLKTPAEKLVDGVRWVGYSEKSKMPPALAQEYLRTMAPRQNRWKLMDLMRHLPGHEREFSPYSRRAGTVRQPVLVIWGKLDRLLPEDAGRRQSRDLPNSRLLEYPHLSHLPHEEAPEIVGPAVAHFLNSPP